MINRILALSIGFIVGIVAATLCDVNSAYLPWICCPVAGAGLTLALWTIHQERRWVEASKAMILIPPLIAGLALGLIRANSVIHADTPAIEFFNGLQKDELFDMKGAIVAEPEQRGPRSLVLRLRLSALKKASNSAWIDVSGDDVRVTVSKPRSKSKAAIFAALADSRAFGNVITARASWTPIPGSDSPGGFNMKAFLLAEGCVADIKLYNWRKRGELRGTVTDVESHKGFFMIEWALAAKRNFITTYCYTMPSPESRLVSGATLGARFALRGHKYHGTLIEDIFRSAGVG
ncbi:MAG: DUF4131 domain-containing protein, partial [Victivallales bacterium]|nr:DUF4131 domain-containing protein [Victivallales bacterium]